MEPLTLMQEGAAQLHELYLSYVEAGFTEEQAMQLICALMTTIMRGQQP